MAEENPLNLTSGDPERVIAGQLATSGLNMCALLDARDIDDPAVPNNTRTLMVIGSYGNRLWQCVRASEQAHSEDPVDNFCAAAVTDTMQSLVGDRGWTLLFPHRAPAPRLQNLGQAAGWHHPSPLGNGIHPLHGLWFAYRAVVALDIALTPTGVGVRTESPCLSCSGRPCIQACPADALQVGKAPNLTACVGYRVMAESPCADRCLAREQCPLGAEARYPDDQIRYHYRQSLLSLRRWVAENPMQTRS
jgi:hypothetical protein